MTFAYDSFNVEDLHTVDEGVIEHLFPLLKDDSKPWDFLIGHFLGVDHVGHRVGPDHPVMKTKLGQMDRVLRDVVDALDDDTLLVLMGDHGMDRKGDHGGDTELEVTAAVWFYSKGRPLLHPSGQIPPILLPESTFPGATVPHRSIQQIDLVPTFSLMLGLPIPYNNLGSITPELFWDDLEGRRFNRALEINTAQIQRYLRTYRESPHGSELDNAWSSLEQLRETAVEGPPGAYWTSLNDYMRATLAVCRELWAQFNVTLIGMGLTLLGTGIIATWLLWTKLADEKDQWEAWEKRVLRISTYAMGVGVVFGAVSIPYRSYVKGLEAVHVVLFTVSLTSVLSCIVTCRPKITDFHLKSAPIVLILHAIAFGSNSFTVWEDSIITFLLLSSLAPSILAGFTAPTPRLRYRILGFLALFALCIRLMAVSTVCREEQQPNCHVTFFCIRFCHRASIACAGISPPNGAGSAICNATISQDLSVGQGPGGTVPTLGRAHYPAPRLSGLDVRVDRDFASHRSALVARAAHRENYPGMGCADRDAPRGLFVVVDGPIMSSCLRLATDRPKREEGGHGRRLCKRLRGAIPHVLVYSSGNIL